MKSIREVTWAGTLVLALACQVSANTTIQTEETGGGQSFTNLQESLAITYFVSRTGTFPSRGEGSSGATMPLGFIRMGGINFYPGSSFGANGVTTSISQNQALFALYGTSFGGDGRTSFGIPDLRGTAPRHVGGGSRLGGTQGESQTTLGIAQIPTHQHDFSGGNYTTDSTGEGISFSNLQPSQGLNYIVNIGGGFPDRNFGSNSAPFLGQVALFGGNFAPRGWAFADGQLVNLEDNAGLFPVIGTTFGGDGRTTYGLPDLRDRLVIGADGLRGVPLGSSNGESDITLEEKNIPAHGHGLPDPFGSTELVGQGEPLSNGEPTVGLNYLIATSGLFPSRNGGVPEEKFLGEITLFAGGFAPNGWAFANGELLDISSNEALFALLGTSFGGDGRTTFALPDLRGRVAIGTGLGADGINYRIGGVYGTDNIAITEQNLPAHFHSATVVPLPAALPLMIAALGMLGARCRRS